MRSDAMWSGPEGRSAAGRSTLEEKAREVFRMHTLVGWHVDMEFQEDGDRTRAAALVRLGDGTEVRGTDRPSATRPTPGS